MRARRYQTANEFSGPGVTDSAAPLVSQLQSSETSLQCERISGRRDPELLSTPEWLSHGSANIEQERNELEDVGQWACGRPDVGGGLPPIDSDGEDAVFSEELTLEKLQEPGASAPLASVSLTLSAEIADAGRDLSSLPEANSCEGAGKMIRCGEHFESSFPLGPGVNLSLPTCGESHPWTHTQDL